MESSKRILWRNVAPRLQHDHYPRLDEQARVAGAASGLALRAILLSLSPDFRILVESLMRWRKCQRGRRVALTAQFRDSCDSECWGADPCVDPHIFLLAFSAWRWPFCWRDAAVEAPHRTFRSAWRPQAHRRSTRVKASTSRLRLPMIPRTKVSPGA